MNQKVLLIKKKIQTSKPQGSSHQIKIQISEPQSSSHQENAETRDAQNPSNHKNLDTKEEHFHSDQDVDPELSEKVQLDHESSILSSQSTSTISLKEATSSSEEDSI